MKKKIQPLSDRVLIKPMEAEAISKGGIIIPDTAKEKPQRGKVISVGPGLPEHSFLSAKLSFIIQMLLWICKGVAKLSGFKMIKEEPDDSLPMVVKENDIVLYGKYAGLEIELEGEKYLIMRESDILAVI